MARSARTSPAARSRTTLRRSGDLHGGGRAALRVFRHADGTREEKAFAPWSRGGPLSHPEWSAAIWARCRYRLAKALLSVPRDTLLGCCVDALYLTTDPGWEETGKVGEFRVKGRLAGPLPAPRTLADLHRMSDEARDV